MPNKIRDKGGLCRGRQEGEGSSRVRASIKWNKAGISRERKGKEGEGRYKHCKENSGTSRGRRENKSRRQGQSGTIQGHNTEDK